MKKQKHLKISFRGHIVITQIFNSAGELMLSGLMMHAYTTECNPIQQPYPVLYEIHFFLKRVNLIYVQAS